jgi:predicted ATP-grasp superfamily ATP-dependent carboligase
MRNLLGRGVKTVAFDCNPALPGFRSVHGKTYLCPNPDEEPSAWLTFMLDLAEKVGGKPVLIPASDQFVTAIATHSFELAKHFVFCHEAAGLQASLATKENQYALAQQHGMPIPRSQYITSSAQLQAFALSARFPCLLKPLHCREWEKMPASNPLTGTKLGTASSPQELLALYKSVQAFTPEVVVQEMIEGPDTAKVVYLSCYSLTGKRLASCLVREIRTGPIYFGSASVVEPVDDPETDALSNHFLTSIGYAGICELELKRDSRDASVKLIEANPRYSGTADAAPYAGVDIGWIHYLDLLGIDVKPVQQNSHHFRHIAVQRDFSSLRSYRRAGLLTWRQLFESYRPPVYFYDFEWYDWRVALATLKEVFKSIVGPSVRRVFPKR